MKIHDHRSSSLIIFLCGSALALASFACGSSTSGNGSGGAGGRSSKGGNGGAGTAGSSGGAGTAGLAGSSGGLGGDTDAAVPGIAFTFDSSVDGFKLQTYVDPGTYQNLGALAADAGVPNGGSYPTLTFNSTAGSPNPGSLQVTANFTHYNQYVEILLDLSPPADLTGLTLTALVQATSSFNGGAFLYAKTGASYTYGSGSGTELTAGTWVPLSFDLSSAAVDGGFAPTLVDEIGLHIYSAGTPPDAGAFAAGTVTFLVDQIVTQ